jgi:hypothetical protein
VGLASTGCFPTEVLRTPGFGNLPGLDGEKVLESASVSGGLEACRVAALAAAGTLLVVVAGMTAGGIWFGWFTSVLKTTSGWLLWSGLAVITIGAFGREEWYAPDYVIRHAGQTLGRAVNPTQDVARPYVEVVASTARATEQLRTLVSQAGTDPNWMDKAGVVVGIAFLTSNPIGAWLLYINSTAVLMMKMLLQASYAFLIAFYTMMGPLVAVCLIVPPWRRVFWAYLRVYLSIALWPAAWGLCERALDGVTEGWFGSMQGAWRSGDMMVVAQSVGVGATMTFIANCLFFFVYLGVPIATTMLVNSAGKSFRDR